MKEQLPKGWCHLRVGDLSKAFNGRAFKSSEWKKSGFPIIRIQNLKNTDAIFNYYQGEIDSRYLVKKGDLLFAWSGTPGTSFGAHLWKGDDALLNQHIFKLVFDNSVVNEKFFCLALNQNVLGYVKQSQGGVGLAHITKPKFDNSIIPLPPFNEQKRIVAKVEELFAEIDKGTEGLLKAKEFLKAYRQSILKNAFEGKLTEEWRNKHIKNTYPNTLTDKQISDDIFPQLPEGWGYIQLGNLIEEPKYGTSKKCTYDAEGIGVLRIPNIVDGTIDTTDLKFAKFDDVEKASYNLMSGDILIIRSNGSISIVGKGALITENAEQYLFAGYLIRLRPYKHLIFPNFLASLLSSHFLRTQIENKAKSTSGVNNINSNELKSLLIPLCELEEQKIIVNTLKEYLSTIDNLEEEIQNGLHRLNALRQSVLKKAFSGKLVPQDINDELASALLARIKAENENQKPLKKKSKQRQKVAV